MRKGEALALTWDDLEGSAVSVTKTLTLGKNNKKIIQSTKSEAGDRKVELDDETISILKEWKHQQAQELLELKIISFNRNRLIFTNSIENKYLNLPRPGQMMDKVINKHKLKRITPHGFRHTHCSLLFEAGATLKEVQDRLGHEDIRTTMDIYAHVTEGKKQETVSKFIKYMEG